MNRLDQKNKRRLKRRMRIRKDLAGTGDRPRMTVYRSNRYLYVQVVDDSTGSTLVSASTIEKDLRNLKKTTSGAQTLGEAVGKRLKEKKIDTVVFDRNGYLYHGVVKALADGARKSGIRF